MTRAFIQSARHATLAMALLFLCRGFAEAQDPQTAPTPMDEKARLRAEREAKKAAEDEEKAMRAAAERERKDAEASARARDRAATRPVQEQAAENPAALTREQERLAKAEEKARVEAEKARKREEDRTRAQEAKDAERRRQDEERAEREALKARDNAEKNRLAALKQEQEEADRNARRARATSENVASPQTPAVQAQAPLAPPRDESPVVSNKDDDKRRKELVKQIEKARTERDRLNREAEEAERIARSARNAAIDGQRSYEALTTGLSVEDVAAPVAATAQEAPRKNRFMTKADERQAEASKSGQSSAPDPLRIALDLKSPDAETRERAAFSLASLGPDAAPATRALMAALADANASVRVAAAQALGRIGPGASLALAPLSAALTDPDPAVKNAAQAALLSIQSR